MNPKVSVIIPTYNGSKYLAKTIESVINQTFKDIEIIVVDDGSDECLFPVLSLFSQQIRYIRIERSGPAAARNIGIKLAKGEYISLLDHDDLWHRDKLKVQVEILENNSQCSLVYCYPGLIDAEGNIIKNQAPSEYPSGNVFIDFVIKNRITTFSATLIRKNIFNVIGFLDESSEAMTCDDYDIYLRISDVSKVHFSPSDLVSYRLHPGNLLKNYDQYLRAELFVLKKVLRYSVTIKELSATQVNNIMQEHLYKTYTNFAFKHYYSLGGKLKARDMFWKLIFLKPYVMKNFIYLMVCYLPDNILFYLRRLKHKLFSTRIYKSD